MADRARQERGGRTSSLLDSRGRSSCAVESAKKSNAPAHDRLSTKRTAAHWKLILPVILPRLLPAVLSADDRHQCRPLLRPRDLQTGGLQRDSFALVSGCPRAWYSWPQQSSPCRWWTVIGRRPLLIFGLCAIVATLIFQGIMFQYIPLGEAPHHVVANAPIATQAQGTTASSAPTGAPAPTVDPAPSSPDPTVISPAVAWSVFASILIYIFIFGLSAGPDRVVHDL